MTTLLEGLKIGVLCIIDWCTYFAIAIYEEIFE